MKTNNIIIAAFMLVLSAAGARAAAASAPDDDKEITAGYTVNVNGVEKITNRSVAVVHYTQGAQSSVRVVESGRYPSRVKVRGNTLMVDLPPKKEVDEVYGSAMNSADQPTGRRALVKTDIYVTLPRLTEVYNSSILTLKMEAIKGAGFPLVMKNSGSMGVEMSTVATTAGSMDVNNYGAMRISATSLSMASLDFYNSGSLNISVPSMITSGKQTLKNSGSLTLKMPQVKASSFEANNYGVLHLDGGMAVACGDFSYYNSGSESSGGNDKGAAVMKVTAKTASVKNSGVLRDNVDMRGQGDGSSLSVSDYGVMNNSVKFTGGSAEFYSSGSTTIDADVNCSSLTIKKYSGAGTITVRGNAGTLSMRGTDRKSINVDKLHADKVDEDRFTGKGSGTRTNGNVQNARTNGGMVNQYNP